MRIEPYQTDGVDPPNEAEDRTPFSDGRVNLMSFDELWDRGITYSKEHLRRLEADGLFPVRVELSAARVAWVEEEINQWIQERMENRPARPGNRTG